MSKKIFLPMDTILVICVSPAFNKLINISRLASYGILIYLLFNSAFIEAVILLVLRFVYITAWPIDYDAVTNQFLPKLDAMRDKIDDKMKAPYNDK